MEMQEHLQFSKKNLTDSKILTKITKLKRETQKVQKRTQSLDTAIALVTFIGWTVVEDFKNIEC